ncbi:phosphoribosyl-AMP cyclohydrolase [Brucella intermedia]|uniref:phosphoribosyl-AMP cyclohydrolase n=1 Tax=Brucella intermedia TaxID=94625 RepID=UPI0034CDE557
MKNIGEQIGPLIESRQRIEDGMSLTPQFDANGLIPAVATDVSDGTVLMLAWMNATALKKTIETGEAWYWSRSRQSLWHKGATSGQIQKVEELRMDCDQDAVWLRVRVAGDGGCCHTGRITCFYRGITDGPEGACLRAIEM